jgi:hypothetical protein
MNLLRAIRIRSTLSFVSGVKPEVPCRKILRRVKYPFTYLKILIRKILTPLSILRSHSQMSLLVRLPESSGR